MDENKKWRSKSSSSTSRIIDNSPKTLIYLLKSFSERSNDRRFHHQPLPPTEAATTATAKPTMATILTRQPSLEPPPNNKVQRFFKELKRKFSIKKEKKSIGNCSTPVRQSNLVIEPYDSYNYAKNFDDNDLDSVEPDYLSRSFSARFAALPSSAVAVKDQAM